MSILNSLWDPCLFCIFLIMRSSLLSKANAEEMRGGSLAYFLPLTVIIYFCRNVTITSSDLLAAGAAWPLQAGNLTKIQGTSSWSEGLDILESSKCTWAKGGCHHCCWGCEESKLAGKELAPIQLELIASPARCRLLKDSQMWTVLRLVKYRPGKQKQNLHPQKVGSKRSNTAAFSRLALITGTW